MSVLGAAFVITVFIIFFVASVIAIVKAILDLLDGA